ncbi:MAG: hypothetical protein HOC74_39550 [Gemmatimonadetes bacterium]|nr:hypothetical protein [Gemmatimonadota bacterium]
MCLGAPYLREALRTREDWIMAGLLATRPEGGRGTRERGGESPKREGADG